MASFTEHICQAKHNLAFLENTNKNIPDSWDWQVTVCFYSALHLINAHIVQKLNLHYRTHGEVDNAINPYNSLAAAKLKEADFVSYNSLKNLSRRSRYLISEKKENSTSNALFTYNKHLAKAVRNLDCIMIFMQKEYRVEFNKLSIQCIELKKDSLINFI